MKTITVSEFRKNIRKYADLAASERIIVNRSAGKAFAIVPIEDVEDEGYSPEFVKRILEAKKSVEDGNYTQVKDIENIWESIE